MAKNNNHYKDEEIAHTSWIVSLLTWMAATVIFSIFILSFLPYGNLINKVIVGLFVCVVIVASISRRLWFSLEIIILMVWTCYALLISLFARDPVIALYKSATMFQIAFLSILLSNVIVWSGRLRFFMWAFVLAILFSYLVSLSSFSGYQLGTRQIGELSGRVVGTLRNANTFGIAVVEGLFFLSLLWANSLIFHEKLLIVLVFSILGLAVIQSGSRTAVLAFVLLMVFIGWAFRAYRIIHYPLRFVVFLMGTITFIAVGAIMVEKNPAIANRWIAAKNVATSRDLSKEETGHSLRGRAELARFAFNLTLKHPQGIGLDNFRVWSPTEGYSHSNLMEILVTTGFIGFILYYSLYCILFFKAWRMPDNLFRNPAAKKLILVFPLLILITDISNVSYYSKDIWLAISMVITIFKLAKIKIRPII